MHVRLTFKYRYDVHLLPFLKIFNEKSNISFRYRTLNIQIYTNLFQYVSDDCISMKQPVIHKTCLISYIFAHIITYQSQARKSRLVKLILYEMNRQGDQWNAMRTCGIQHMSNVDEPISESSDTDNSHMTRSTMLAWLILDKYSRLITLHGTKDKCLNKFKIQIVVYLHPTIWIL